MSDSRSSAIGLDIGGTKIAGGVVAFPSGEVLARRVVPTDPGRGGEAVLDDALALATDLVQQCAEQNHKPLGIGIGVPELVSPTGEITSAHSFDWRGLPVTACFGRVAPAMIESDVRAAALGEALFGAGRAFRIFAFVTIGTGISYSLVMDGKPFAGARGNALVLASGALTSACASCGAVSEQVLEEYAAGPAIVRRYNDVVSGDARRGEEVFAAVEAGDPAAWEVVRSAGESLGNTIGFLVNVLDPEAVIVGGGLGQASGLYWESLVRSTRAHIWADNSRDLSIIPAALGTDAGIIGAAATIWRRHPAAP
jgi:glucokinase